MSDPLGADATDVASQLATFAIEYGLRIIAVIVVLGAAFFVGAWVKRLIRRAFERAKFDVTLGKFLGNVAKWGILALALVSCLGIFGIQTTTFAAVIGAAGLAIGLGFQGSLSNLAAGMMLLIFRPFKVGDLVNLSGHLGFVNEIDLFQTSLDSVDGRRIIFPNNQIFGGVIENITHHPRRRFDCPVGVSYGADIDATRRVLEDAVARIDGVLADPAPMVFLDSLGESSVNWIVRVWAPRERFGDVRQATVRAVKYALDQAGISIPFRQLDVHVRTLPKELHLPLHDRS
ncbi:mechanosensitive ion channel [Leptolyngbya sp. 15MV]|nr:mechanosensitive ion channel [Leptolyngbya sp. 15MV]